MFDPEPCPVPVYIPPKPIPLPKMMPRSYEMDAPPIPSAYRKMIYKEQNYFTERKDLPFLIKLLDHRNAKDVLMIIFDFLWLQEAEVSGIHLFKIACLNRVLYSIIRKFYSPMKISDFGRNHHYYRFMFIIGQMPNFDLRFKSDMINKDEYN